MYFWHGFGIIGIGFQNHYKSLKTLKMKKFFIATLLVASVLFGTAQTAKPVTKSVTKPITTTLKKDTAHVKAATVTTIKKK